MKKVITAMLILAIWTVTVCSPVQANAVELVVVNAQPVTAEQMGPFLNSPDRYPVDRSKWGTREYYDNSTPQVTKNPDHQSRIVNLGQRLRIGENPQVAGGISDQNYKLGKDEKWVTLKKTVQVITLDHNARAYIGEIYTGEVVLVDISGRIKAIARCGNWAREIGAQFTLITCDSSTPDKPDPCKDPVNYNAELRLISKEEPVPLEDGSISVMETWGNTCKTQLKQIITKPGKDKPCSPSGNTRVDEFHVQKPIDPFGFIDLSEKIAADQKSAIKELINLNEKNKKITDLIIYYNGCSYSIFAFSIQPGGLGWWKWIIPAIAIGAFLAGYYFARGGTKINAVKTQDPVSGGIHRVEIPW